jgi:hypothetical protein
VGVVEGEATHFRRLNEKNCDTAMQNCLLPNMSSFTFDYIHIVMGMVSCLQMIVAFMVLVQMQPDKSIETPRDVRYQMVLGAIREHDLPQR